MATSDNQPNLPSRAQILEILQTVANPFATTKPESIIEAGFISAPLSRNIDNKVQIGLILDIKGNDGGRGKILEASIIKILTDKTGVTNIQIMSDSAPKSGKHNLIRNNSSKPAAPAGHRPLGSGAKVNNALDNVKNIILVASGKGGVGKSTVAANLAIALSASGARVGLLDADIYGPSLPTMFGINDKPLLNEDKQMVPLEKYGLKLMSIGFIADTNKAMIWRGPMIQGALIQMLNECAWGELDHLVIDLPPGTGDIQLTLVQKFKIAGAVIVSTPQILALDDVRRGIQMFTQTKIPILGIVENMAYFESADGVKNYVFGKGGAKMIAEKINIDLLAEIPLLPTIGQHADMGEPITHAEPNGVAAKYYNQLAQKVAAKL
ncbi:MAG: Mrp/NBP35 family ATP-binding protein [Rhizobiales bacterium]|nr:Mrp/NBP35 family ATP-binding protein [Hyphomicrobiales bacterium]NRB13947.1 Mrp/NBP35 family ATP-binding protein [Hyphomicrobiales bacterium]